MLDPPTFSCQFPADHDWHGWAGQSRDDHGPDLSHAIPVLPPPLLLLILALALVLSGLLLLLLLLGHASLSSLLLLCWSC